MLKTNVTKSGNALLLPGLFYCNEKYQRDNKSSIYLIKYLKGVRRYVGLEAQVIYIS